MPESGGCIEKPQYQPLSRMVSRQPLQTASDEEYAGVSGAPAELHRAHTPGQENGGHQVRLVAAVPGSLIPRPHGNRPGCESAAPGF